MSSEKPSKPKRSSQTKSFGSSKRENHDASTFYQSNLYQAQTDPKLSVPLEAVLPPEASNQLFCKSSEAMSELPNNSIHLVITSPPYNASKDYDLNLSLADYLSLLKRVFTETHRVLASGGRVCINIANLGRSPYIPLHAYVIQLMLELGFLMRGEVIWDKAGSAGISTAWGSWNSPSNPILRDTHEYILIFSKDSFSRAKTGKTATMTKDEFMTNTKSVWSFRSESARKIGHPAPFPEELPYRLIQLYSFEDDVILDPFCGSGTTCVSALKTHRRYVGYDTNPDYIALAQKRLSSVAIESNTNKDRV